MRAAGRLSGLLPGLLRGLPGGLLRGLRSGLAVVALAGGLVVSPAAAQGVEVESTTVDDWARERLGASLTAISGDLAGTRRLLPQHLVLAFGIAQYATEVTPESTAAWRRLLAIATVLEGDFPEAGAAAEEAVTALARLEPDDSVMRLRRILDRVDQEPTAEDRVRLYETLLQPENLDRLGPVAGARVSFDLGLLERRIGELDLAAIRIVDAVNLDPSYPQAAEMLAGLLRTASTSPLEEAELLAIAFTASPLDGVLARRLGQLVLGEGAYGTAADILDLAIILTPSDAPFLADLIGDQALALWADGRPDEARELLQRTLRTRQRTIRQQMVTAGLVTPEEAPSTPVPPTPALALIDAAIVGATGTEAERDSAVMSLFAAYRFDLTRNTRLISEIEADESLSEEVKADSVKTLQDRNLELTIDLAWARAWFGWSPPVVEGEPAPPSLADLLDRVTAAGVLENSQRLIIEGWWAIHQDDFDQARVLLGPAAESSPYAAAGLALLDELVGEKQSAARLFQRTYGDVPGRLVGVWSRHRLEMLLGVSIPAPERAAAMDAIVAATLPEAVGRALRDPKHGVLSVRVEPVSLRNGAFEPVLIDIKITNVSGLDLAIGPDGPILPTIVVVADSFDLPVDPSRLYEGYATIRPPRLVVPIDRRFRLDSQETITIRVDLTTSRMARQFDLQSYFGGTTRLRAVVNYAAAPGGSIDTGLFGREGRSPVFHVDGLAPPTRGSSAESQLAAMLDRIEDPRTVAATKDTAAMLGITMVGPSTLPTSDPATAQSTAIGAVMAMSPVTRAWVMTVIPGGDAAPTRLVDALVTDGDVSLAVALARYSTTPTSAAIVKGLASENPRLRTMAEAARDLAVSLEAALEAEFELGGGSDDG